MTIDTAGSAGARRARTVGWAFAGLAAVAGIFALLLATGVFDLESPWGAVAVVVLVVGALGAVVSLAVGARLRSALGEQRANEVRDAALDALRRVVEREFVAPAQRVLDEHTDVRESALSARESSSTGRVSEA